MQALHKEQTVVVSPLAHPNHFLFISNDKHRNLNDDYDVRTHAHQEERNKFIFIHVTGNIYLIKSHTDPNHFIFCSNDNERKFHEDFDVRTHYMNEERNQWIVEKGGNKHQKDTYTIRSKVAPKYYLFAADDGSNKYGDDFDVRCHHHVEERNKWVIHNFHYHNEE